MAPREVFEKELKELQSQIEGMGRMVLATYRDLYAAIPVKDIETIDNIIKNEKCFYDMKKKIESQCLKVITKQQPVATDLRMISAVLKIVSDIERVGDHAVDIGELVLRNNMREFKNYSVHLDGMTAAANELFENAIKAFVHSDTKASGQIINDDDIVDNLFNKVKYDIINGLKEEHDKEDEYIDMLMVAKYLEKIGDHAVNIAKWQIFRTEGEMV